MSQKIRIKLKSFDHMLVDKSAAKIVDTVKATGAKVVGPIPLPTNKKIFTVNRSTFVNKKSREQFELDSYRTGLLCSPDRHRRVQRQNRRRPHEARASFRR